MNVPDRGQSGRARSSLGVWRVRAETWAAHEALVGEGWTRGAFGAITGTGPWGPLTKMENRPVLGGQHV